MVSTYHTMATFAYVIIIIYIYRRVWFLSACAYIPTAREVGLIQDALNRQVKIKRVWLTLRVDLHVDMCPRSLAKMEHHVSSIIRQRVMVVSSMFT